MCAPSVSTVAVPGSSTNGALRTEATECALGSSDRARGAGIEIGRGGRGVLKVGRLGCEGAARPERPSRCTLPMTALRVTPPNCLAIWLADRPSNQSFLRVSTLSSVQPMAISNPLISEGSVPTDHDARCCAPAASRDDDLPHTVNKRLRTTIGARTHVHRNYMLMRHSDRVAPCGIAAHMRGAMRDMPFSVDTVLPPEPRAYRGINWDG